MEHDIHTDVSAEPQDPEIFSAEPIPALRMDLDFQPSQSEEHPGLVIRDTFHFSDSVLLIPSYLLRFLPYFDGGHTRGELVEAISHSANRDTALKLEAHLRETLQAAMFLEDDTFLARREEVIENFRNSPIRRASHAGLAYPGTAEEIRAYFESNLRPREHAAEAGRGPALGIAAPHISFEGGWNSYSALASTLRDVPPDSLFVVLGTSHYGEQDRFGITSKVFETPLGETRAEPRFVEALASAAPDAVTLEDYCHSIDHSLEFHILMLQHLIRPDVRVLPILVGRFGNAMTNGGFPDEAEGLSQFFAKLRELAGNPANHTFFLLSVDMAHMGKRYGDAFEAQAFLGEMADVARIDRERIAMLEAGDCRGFWRDVARRDAELKWCGSSTLYTFLQIYPQARARLIEYEQWNIDPVSTVSFGTMSFHGQ